MGQIKNIKLHIVTDIKQLKKKEKKMINGITLILVIFMITGSEQQSLCVKEANKEATYGGQKCDLDCKSFDNNNNCLGKQCCINEADYWTLSCCCGKCDICWVRLWSGIGRTGVPTIITEQQVERLPVHSQKVMSLELNKGCTVTLYSENGMTGEDEEFDG